MKNAFLPVIRDHSVSTYWRISTVPWGSEQSEWASLWTERAQRCGASERSERCEETNVASDRVARLKRQLSLTRNTPWVANRNLKWITALTEITTSFWIRGPSVNNFFNYVLCFYAPILDRRPKLQLWCFTTTYKNNQLVDLLTLLPSGFFSDSQAPDITIMDDGDGDMLPLLKPNPINEFDPQNR